VGDQLKSSDEYCGESEADDHWRDLFLQVGDQTASRCALEFAGSQEYIDGQQDKNCWQSVRETGGVSRRGL
jgi:hypothetical protein